MSGGSLLFLDICVLVKSQFHDYGGLGMATRKHLLFGAGGMVFGYTWERGTNW